MHFVYVVRRRFEIQVHWRLPVECCIFIYLIRLVLSMYAEQYTIKLNIACRGNDNCTVNLLCVR